MNNTIHFTHNPCSADHHVDVNILTMLKQAASCLTEMQGDVYLAAIGPDMELTIIMQEDAPSILPCFDEDDASDLREGCAAVYQLQSGAGPQAGRQAVPDRSGHLLPHRWAHASTIVSLTVEDIYRFQKYLESHSTTLMADEQKLTCICID